MPVRIDQAPMTSLAARPYVSGGTLALSKRWPSMTRSPPPCAPSPCQTSIACGSLPARCSSVAMDSLAARRALAAEDAVHLDMAVGQLALVPWNLISSPSQGE